MKNLRLAEVEQSVVDVESVKLELKRIQMEIMRDASKQKRAFLFGNFKFIFYSLVIYAGAVLFAWARYHK